jgi:hypothetical protein
MKQVLEALSLHEAFMWLKKEVIPELPEDQRPKHYLSFVDLDMHGINYTDEDFIKSLEGKGILYGCTEYPSGENTNKVLVSIKNHPKEGEKKWESAYIAVYDFKSNFKAVPGSEKTIKKECIDIARAASEAEKRHTYVVLIKRPVNFKRLEAEIIYKPSQGQKLGKYLFIW